MALAGSGRMVGRDEELAELCTQLGLGSAEPAAGGNVLLAGDAGVGKTRLLAALRDEALAAGWQVCAGYCLDFGEDAPPYLPFSEIIGRLTVEAPEAVATVTASHRALTRLRPGRRTMDRAPSEETTVDRGDLFEAVHALLEEVAAVAPLLLVVEDLHWADQSTRDMLSFLFGRPFEHRVAIVASYRADDLHRRHPLRSQVAEWTRSPRVQRLALGPLAPDAVRELVADLHGGQLDEAEIAGILARSEGNAFFVEELVAAGLRGALLPDDLAGLLLVRIDRLDGRARDLVRAASVGGRKVPHPLLSEVLGLPPHELEAGLRQAVDANVLVPGPGGYSFRHALLAEAVYDDLLPGERVRLHAAYVAALQSEHATGTAAELARHARAAMDYETAVTASIRAGEDARAVGGPGEAAHHFQQAIELLADPRRAPSVDVDRSHLAVQAAEALSTSGRPGRAADLLREQLTALGPAAEAPAQARMLSARALALSVIEPDEDPVEVSATAVALLDGHATGLRAQVLAVHAGILSSRGRFEEAESVGLDALALAERLDRSALVSDVMTTLSFLKRTGSPEAARTALREAVEKAERARAVPAEVRGRFLLGRSYQDQAELEEAAAWFRSGSVLAGRAGIPWAPYAFECRWQLAWVLIVIGRWDEALEVLEEGPDPGPPIPHALLQVLRAHVQVARGQEPDVSGLRGLWEEEGLLAVQHAEVTMLLAARAGDAAGVLAAYDDVVDVVGGIWHRWFGARVRLAACAQGGLARCLPGVLREERPLLLARAEGLLDDGLAVHQRFVSDDDPWGPEGEAWLQQLVAETLRVRWLADTGPPPYDELVRAWSEAVTLMEDFGDVHRTARARTALAGVLRAGGDVETSREVAARARIVAQALGAEPLLAELRELGAGRTARTTSPASTELTPREREILELVAQGGSNGEIGRRLFISTKTVSVHVSNILAKLGATSRTEAVALARSRGLLPR